MSQEHQKTVKKEISITGIGLHSGALARVSIAPASADHGIVFTRGDLPGSASIPAHFSHVVSTQLATTLGIGKAQVSTVEHLLAALHGTGIDNAKIEVSGPEVPILDGSSRLFVDAIQRGGIESQRAARPYLQLRRRVEIKIQEKWAVAEPSSRFEVHGSIDWDHPSIGYQEFHYIEGKTNFAELANARTFGFLRDVEALKRMGLARGGSLENAIVLDDALVLNPDGLRSPDEFARHKVLDAIGDFKLAGLPIHAYIRLHRAGHDLHGQLLSAIFRDPDNFEIVDGKAAEVEKRREVRPRLIAARTRLAHGF